MSPERNVNSVYLRQALGILDLGIPLVIDKGSGRSGRQGGDQHRENRRAPFFLLVV